MALSSSTVAVSRVITLRSVNVEYLSSEVPDRAPARTLAGAWPSPRHDHARQVVAPIDPPPRVGKTIRVDSETQAWEQPLPARRRTFNAPRGKQQTASDPQINGYLAADERAAFERYAESFELDISSLACLLVMRELNLGRLGQLLRDYPSTRPGRSKVTAHLKRNPTVKAAFTSQVSSMAVSESAAAGAVFRAELSERWLARSVGRAEGHEKGLTPVESSATLPS
jgi:hypothetical protein